MKIKNIREIHENCFNFILCFFPSLKSSSFVNVLTIFSTFLKLNYAIDAEYMSQTTFVSKILQSILLSQYLTLLYTLLRTIANHSLRHQGTRAQSLCNQSNQTINQNIKYCNVYINLRKISYTYTYYICVDYYTVNKYIHTHIRICIFCFFLISRFMKFKWRNITKLC